MDEDNEEAPDDQRISELIDKSGNDIRVPLVDRFYNRDIVNMAGIDSSRV